ncbi:MAG: gliding motility-associated C-terminal domain-containing protein [Schleiferiaceae bacterium]|nr:gliding motility-associated C-terminal domain-containing protein [Schleiferiaceae bacterium]
MRSRILWTFLLMGFLAHSQPIEISRPSMGFIPNQGQWPSLVLAQLPTETARIWILQNGLRFTLRGPSEEDSSDLFVFTERFQGAQTGRFKGGSVLPGHLSYFLPSGAAAKVPHFASATINGLYPGVKLELELSPDGFLKTTWVGESSQDLMAVASQFEGLANAHAQGHYLRFTLPSGALELDLPEAQGARGPLTAHWRQIEGAWTPVARGADRIDPVYRFSTFSGSVSDNFGYTATYDLQGRTWIGGIAFGAQFPVFNGVQSSFAGGGTDVALMLFSPDGTSLLCGSYYGGGNREQPHSMMVGPNGDLVVMGVTSSSNLPHAVNSYDTTFSGASSINGGGQSFNQGTDIFLLRLDSTGSLLQGMTYLGGTGNDGINANVAMNYGDQARGEVLVATDGIYIASSTLSTNFPSTLAAHHGLQDGIVAKLSPSLDNLIWSSYYGGSSADGIFGAALHEYHGQLKLFTVGATYSDSLASATSHQALRQGLADAWVQRINATTGMLEKTTYLGTTGPDLGYLIAQNPDGAYKAIGDSSAIAIVGNTKGILPATSGLWGQSMSSQYMAWLGYDLDTVYRLQTFGSGTTSSINCSPTAFMMDGCGSLYFSGWGGLANNGGNTQNLFTTPNAYQTTTDGSDFYFLVLNRKGAPLYASYFGGSTSYEHVDGGTSRFDPEGVIHQAICAGCGGNSSLPVFPHNAYSLTNNAGNCNMAAVQIAFSLQSAAVTLELTADTLCAGNQAFLSGILGLADSVYIDWGDGSILGGSMQPPFTHLYGLSGPFVISVEAYDTVCATQASQQIPIFISSLDEPKAEMNLVYDPCDTALHVELHPTDSLVSQALLVLWGDGNSHYERMKCPLIHNYRGIYGPITITLIALDTLCGDADTAYYVVTFRPPLSEIHGEITVNPCGPAPLIYGAANANYATQVSWYPNGFSASPLLGRERFWQVSGPGNYEVAIVVWDSICDRRDTAFWTYEVLAIDSPNAIQFPNMFSPNGDGLNDAFRLSQSGASGLEQLYLIVYDRWGQKVFVTSEPNFSWDGSFRGRSLLDGVYFYVAQWRSTCGMDGESKGSITLNKTLP